MAQTIINSVKPVKERLETLIDQVKEMKIQLTDSTLSTEEQLKFHKTNNQSIDEKILRLQMCIESIEASTNRWIEYFQKSKTKKEDEEEYAKIATGNRNIFILMHEAREAVVTLTLYKREVNNEIERLTQISSPAAMETTSQRNINLPQLPLPTFNGDPRQWREFWSGFNTAVHSQDIPQVQKMNYLISCLRGAALQSVRGFDVAPENYEIVCQLLTEKYGDSSTIIKLLYNELYATKRNDKEWVETVERMERIFRQLEMLGEDLDHSSIENTIENKLPRWILEKVYHKKMVDSPWSTTKLRKFLRDLISVNEQIKNQVSSTQSNTTSQEPKSVLKIKKIQKQCNETSALATLHDNKNPQNRAKNETRKRRPCAFCDQDHWDSECDTYPSVKLRIKRLKELKKCINCFKMMHSNKKCEIKVKCFYCKGSHNSALCDKRKPSKGNMMVKTLSSNQIQQDEAEDDSTTFSTIIMSQVNTTFDDKRKGTLLLCKEILVLNPAQPECNERVLALFDIGSQLSFISKKLAKRINLTEVSKEEMRLAPFGVKEPKSCLLSKVQFDVQMNDQQRKTLLANVVEHITNELQVVNVTNDKQIASAESYWRKPDILIGADYFFQFIGFDKIETLESGFVLIHTKFGPLISGCGDLNKLGQSKVSHVSKTLCVANVHSCSSEMDRFWKLETIGINDPSQDNDDEEALRQFKSSVIKKERYQVRWPWKNPKVNLSDNYNLCFYRLKGLVKHLRNSNLLSEYHENINEQKRLDIIEEIDVSNTEENLGVICYLPHHAVETPHKSTKLRIVYDASAHTKGKKSLNEMLYRGPVLLPDMVGVLLRFRAMQTVIVADIEKAYLQVELHPEDRNSTRFLWIKDKSKSVTSDNLKYYRFKRMPFGVISSPFLLSATLNYHLEHYGSPVAAEIRKNIYVDNIILSANDTQDAINKYGEVKSIFEDAGMNVREFLSNDEIFNDNVDNQDLATSNKGSFLGIKWLHENDVIRVTLKPWKEKTITKRTILQFVASQYDPLGYLVPSIIIFKLFLQTLWKENKSWDEPLSHQNKQRWNSMMEKWPSMVIDLPRFVIDTSCYLELHTFTDASSKAYSAAVYILNTRNYRQSTSSLIFAKSRIQPIKGMTIPRLELMSVLIGVRATQFVIKQLELKEVPVTIWSDSKCVLFWIKNDSRLLPKFVQNRIDEIRKAKFIFRYIPTNHNPVDVATRGIPATKLKNQHPWWKGPEWLTKDKSLWPQWKFKYSGDDEFGKTILATIRQIKRPIQVRKIQVIDETRFSRWIRMLRTTVWVLRFIKKTSKRNISWLERVSFHKNYMTKIDYDIAARVLVKQAQTNGIEGKQITEWNLFRDELGIWRTRSRLQNAEINEESKFPIYLPHRSRITELIVRHKHEQLYHAGTAHILCELRQQFWIPKGRATIKRAIHDCMRCKRWRATPFQLPEMANLPKSRVTKSKPFERVGLDYLGPLNIKTNEGMVKRWVALFTCFTTRAVHLEVAENLTAETFVHLFRRFVARRGCPQLVLSDNASQFQLVFKAIKEKTTNFLSERGMVWRNVIPKAPWKGGIYERMIGLTKNALRKAIGRKLLRENELITLIVEIEGVLNSRPLNYASFDDYEVVRPIDFLLPKASLDVPIDSKETQDEYLPHSLDAKDKLIKYWKNTLKSLDIFWEIWKNEYLNCLRERTQTDIASPKRVQKRSPRLGEIVLLNEPNVPRGMWKLAKIEEFKLGSDNKVRAVTIKLPNGRLLDRPINMLSPLEIDEDESSGTSSQNNKDLINVNQPSTNTGQLADEPIAHRTRSAEK